MEKNQVTRPVIERTRTKRQCVSDAEVAQSTERVSSMSEENSTAAQSLLRLANDLEEKAREVKLAVEVFSV